MLKLLFSLVYGYSCTNPEVNIGGCPQKNLTTHVIWDEQLELFFYSMAVSNIIVESYKQDFIGYA